MSIFLVPGNNHEYEREGLEVSESSFLIVSVNIKIIKKWNYHNKKKNLNIMKDLRQFNDNSNSKLFIQTTLKYHTNKFENKRPHI